MEQWQLGLEHQDAVLRERDEHLKREQKKLIDTRLQLNLDRQRLDDDEARIEKEKKEDEKIQKQVTVYFQQLQDILNDMQEKREMSEMERQEKGTATEDVGQAVPYWLDTFFVALNKLEGRTAGLDALLEKWSKRIDGSWRDGTKETAMLAMHVANPILQLMRDMDREGCEVTDEMIRQASKEVRELADTTEEGIQKVLGQLSKMEHAFADKLDALKAMAEGQVWVEAELKELQKTLDEVKSERDCLKQELSYRPWNNVDFEDMLSASIEDTTGHIEFGQYPCRPNTSLTRLLGNRLWNCDPVDFVSFLSPKVTDNHYDFSLVDNTMAETFFARVAYRVVRYKHRHFRRYNEVRIPRAADGQGPLIVGQDPPSIANWGAWNCVNAMMQNSDDDCCCPDDARYCLRYQVWCISPGPAGSTQNVLKLMWFEIDPLRTGWDVLRAMGNKYWIPVNFVTLFSCAKDAAENHPQWCDLSAVDDFFVTLMIGNSSGKREECFRHANYFLEDTELDEVDGVISNHCDIERTGLLDWDKELQEDQEMDNWQCLNFALALSEEEAEDHLRNLRATGLNQQDQDGWMMETCCCPAHTAYCLAIRSETKSNTSGESYKVVRVKWIERFDPDYESGRMLASPVCGTVDPEVEEKLKLAFQADVVEEYDEDETDNDGGETDDDEEIGETKDKEEMSSLFSGSDDGDVAVEDQGESHDKKVAEETGEDQDGSPDTLDFEGSSPAYYHYTKAGAYSPRRSLSGLTNLPVTGQRRSRSEEDEGEGKSKRRRVDNTADGTEESEEPISGTAREWEWITENQQFMEKGKR
ncbi:hypothetical protein QBC36DRAFT_340839 [Triangularia setosa]|uniref:Uncharacterized protein n=1 Tax=Triangularia setosa TaxID=2587417 RepID=A0AAN6VYR0_9PEZI|nr:hypothetical protein QBC36DRAFT_340839 [Podospora setosa]